MLDGLGALVTALCVGLLLPLAQPWVGVPVATLRWLGGLAVVIAVFSLSRHVSGPPPPWVLRVVASANLSYVALTAVLLGSSHWELEPLAYVYFGGEFAIVIVLAWRELTLANEHHAG